RRPLHPHARPARRLAGLRGPRRPRAARGDRLADERKAPCVHLRAQRLRRGRGQRPRRARTRAVEGEDRAVRAELMEALDGNAIAGTLFAAFGGEMTTAVGVCANCGARRQVAEVRAYLRGPGVVARCPSCDAVLMVL